MESVQKRYVAPTIEQGLVAVESGIAVSDPLNTIGYGQNGEAGNVIDDSNVITNW